MSELTRRMRAHRTLLPLCLSLALLWSCSGGHSGSASTSDPPPPALSITTATLPNGQVGRVYSATLGASGGTAPLSWSLTGGALPAGLALTAATGAITGTPTATANATPLTFAVSDSGATRQTQSVTLKLNVSPAGITVAVSPARAGITTTQTLTLAVNTNDYAGVLWSTTAGGGTVAPASSPDGGQVTYTPPATAGSYTVTATSLTDGTQHAAVTIGVTDLPGVYTYHNDLSRDGTNSSEYALTPANVNTASFGKLFSCPVDGAVYAQPLWVANLAVNGARHNVVFVATQHDSLYAFDADASPCQLLWQVSLIDSAHGGTGVETSVPAGVPGYLLGRGPHSDITPEIGVTGTPVIDPARSILFVVSKSVNPAGPTPYQRLHAIDLASGAEQPGSPVTIAATYPGTADGGSKVTFDPLHQNQRPGLALVNGTVYLGWGSHDDAQTWHGWLAGYTYSGTAFTQSGVFLTTPDGSYGGVWMGGGAPSADAAGNLYVITGNGLFDAANASAPNVDYGDSFLQLSGALHVSSWFAPTDESTDYTGDVDFGSGGSAVLLNLATGPVRHLVVGGGKDGALYVLNGDSMGGFGDPNAWQKFSVGHGIFATGAFWNNTLYLAPVNSGMLAYAFDPSTYMFNSAATSKSATVFPFSGSTPSVSASGPASNGIVWGIDNSANCTGLNSTCGPAVLHAYDATDLTQELWNSKSVAADAAGNAVKFIVPTVANGKVYVGTRGNNTGGVYQSTSISGELDVYGLKPD